MAKINVIELHSLQYWSTATNTWVDLYAQNGSGDVVSLGPSSTHTVSLFNKGIGQGLNPANPFSYSITWDYFEVNDGSGVTEEWTLFYTGTPPAGTNLLPSTIKSLRIRYKLRVVDDSDPVNVWEPTQWYYQIIQGAYPTDHITYSNTITTGPFAPTVIVKLPGISNTMVTNSTTLFSWMTVLNNWTLRWRRPDGSEREYAPSSISILGTYASTDPNFNGAYVSLRLVFPTLMVGQSGTHTLTVSFLPNDQQVAGFVDFADVHTWTAVIQAYTPSMSDPLLMSFDQHVFMTITFASS